MELDAGLTLGELVTRVPGAAPVLEGLQLDYCCGGHRTLAAAAAEAGLDPTDVLVAISQVPTGPGAGEPDWSTLSMSSLVDHLLATHHHWLKGALARVDELAAKVESVHGQNHPELHTVRSQVSELRADLEPHMAKEEGVLFPFIRQLDAADVAAPSFHCGSLRNPISVMQYEHERTGELLAALRETTGGYSVPDDACASYRALYEGLAAVEADTHLHIHKENNVLFPAVVAAESALSSS